VTAWQPQGIEMAAVSDCLTHLHMRFYGPGPIRAKSHLVDFAVELFLLNPEVPVAAGFRGPA